MIRLLQDIKNIKYGIYELDIIRFISSTSLFFFIVGIIGIYNNSILYQVDLSTPNPISIDNQDSVIDLEPLIVQYKSRSSKPLKDLSEDYSIELDPIAVKYETLGVNYASHSLKSLKNPNKAYFSSEYKHKDISLTEIDEIAMGYGIPNKILSSLMLVETNGNCQSVSSAGARGCFQFMDSTAKGFGLISFDQSTKKNVDYRENPYISADAAARYLVWIHKYLSNTLEIEWDVDDIYDWQMALEAYNGGISTSLKYRKRKAHPYRETLEYQRKILLLASGRGHYVRELELLSSISKDYGVTYEELKHINKGIDNESIKAGSIILIDPPDEVFWDVKRGDYIYKIAKEIDVSALDILSYNNLKSTDIINVGDRIKIPKAKKHKFD